MANRSKERRAVSLETLGVFNYCGHCLLSDLRLGEKVEIRDLVIVYEGVFVMLLFEERLV